MSWPDPATVAEALERDAARRATSLSRLRLLGSGPHPSTTRLMRLAIRTMDATYAALVLVDGRLARVHAATHRLAPAFPAETSLAALAITADEDIAVADPGEQRRHPTGLPIRTEAAAVVRAPDGVAVGAIEVGWATAVALDDGHRTALRDLAGLANGVLELRAEVEEYRRFVDLSPDPVAILDLAGAVQRVNPALLDLLNAGDRTAVVDRSFIELVARADRARVAAELTRVPFSRINAGRMDTNLVRANGEEVACSLSIGLLGGTRRHLQVVIHDLSGRQRDEDARTQLSEQLARAQRLDAVGQVAGGLAHDLNNLLVIMTTNLSMAGESLEEAVSSADGAFLSTLREDLGEVEVAVDRASAMTRQLLHFARREQGEADRADVADVIDAVRGLVERSLGAGVDLEVSVADELPMVAADPVQLERSVLNLVNNARDALDGSGAIRVSASLDVLGVDGVERRSEFSDRANRPMVRLSVSDDGMGMDDVTRARACEPLFTTKVEGKGTGLGLSAVLAFADESDAVLTLHSAPGEGTTAELLLPLHHAAEELAVGGDRPVAGARVVLVDPGERTRRVIARMLGDAGYRVSPFSSGEEALEAIERGGADLMVTELVLPAMTGSRLIADARRHVDDLPVVVLASVEAPRALEGDPVLVKPFSQTRLLRTVQRVLSGR